MDVGKTVKLTVLKNKALQNFKNHRRWFRSTDLNLKTFKSIHLVTQFLSSKSNSCKYQIKKSVFILKRNLGWWSEVWVFCWAGQWGECGPTCPGANNTDTVKCKSKSGADCVIPFSIEGYTFYGCVEMSPGWVLWTLGYNEFDHFLTKLSLSDRKWI